MFTHLARIILRNRILLIILLLIFTSFMAYKATFVQLSYQYIPVLPASDTASVQFNEFKKVFKEDGNIMVLGFQSEKIRDISVYNDWVILTKNIEKIEGVNQTFSFSNTSRIIKNTEFKKFELTPVFSGKIETQDQLDSLFRELHALPFYRGILFNDSTNSYLLSIDLNKKYLQTPQRNKLVREIIQLSEDFSQTHQIELHYSGLPYIRIKMANKIRSELFMFIFLAIGITALILYLFFRSVKVVLISLLIVTIGVIWSFGTMALLNFKITTLTAIIPPLLIVIGIPNSVFLLNKYHYEYKKHGNKIKALQRVIQKIGNATFLTNLTTASGFATFIFTSTKILREFGWVASLNIMGIFILSLLLIPIIYSFLSPPKERHTKHLDNGFIGGLINRLITVILYHRKAVYLVTALLIIFGVYGLTLIKRSGYIVDDLPAKDPVITDLAFFENHFSGLIPLEISIDTQKKKGILKTSTLKKINDLQEKLKTYPELSPPLSIVEMLKFTRQAYYNGGEAQYKLPGSMERNFILSYIPEGNASFDILSSLMDSTRSIARISYRVADIGTNKMKELSDKIFHDLRQIFPQDQFNYSLTGSSIIAFKGNKYLIQSLITSLILAVVLISVFMALMFSSWRMVFISLLPNIIPLLITAALMGYFGIPIKPSTVLVFSIAFGISVDDSIHYLAKYRQELKASNMNIRRAVIYAIRETGVSMLYTSVVLFFGFGIFSLSDFGGTVALGVLVSITLFIAMFSNLIILPSLLLSLERRMIQSSFKEPLMQIFNEEEDVDHDQLTIKKTEEANIS